MFKLFLGSLVLIFSMLSTRVLANSFEGPKGCIGQIGEELLNKSKEFFTEPSSPTVQSWIESQNRRLREYEGSPDVVAELGARRKFFSTGLEPMKRVFKQGAWKNGPNGELILVKASGTEHVIIEPKKLLHPRASISDILLSPDQSRVAIALIIEGGDVKHWYLYDFELNSMESSVPFRIRFEGLNWSLDSRGVFYSVWPSEKQEDENVRNKIVPRVPIAFHVFGEERAHDKVILEHDPERPGELLGVVELAPKGAVLAIRKPNWVYLPEHYRVGTFSEDGKSVVWNKWKYDSKVRVKFITNESGVAYFESSAAGNNFGVVSWQVKEGKLSKKVLITADPQLVLLSAQKRDNLFFLTYVTPSLSTVLRVADLKGKILREITAEEIKMPSSGTFSWILNGATEEAVHFSFSSPIYGPQRFRMDQKTFEISINATSGFFPKKFDDLTEGSGFATSKDGTRVPLYFIHHKGKKPSFVYMLYYGAVGLVSTPGFSHRLGTVLALGGAVAIVNPRGSGALGFQGFQEGGREKLKTIDDLAAAGTWLKDNLKPTEGRLVGHGGSWGGLHTYQLAVFYPDIFDVLLSYIPVSSMEVYQPSYLGWAIGDDLFFKRNRFGFLKNFDQQLEKVIDLWDPFQKVPCITRIPTILTLGSIRDQRTGPEQHYLFTHALQAKFGSDATAFLTIDEGNFWGHGSSEKQELLSLGFLAKRYGISIVENLVPK